MVFSAFAAHVRYALLILLIVTLIILLSKWTGSTSKTITVVTDVDKSKELLRLSTNMLTQAEAQTDPSVALMHTAYADAYLDAAERVSGGKGLHSAGLKAKVHAKQQQLMHTS
jgi:hypothetical protein